MSGMKDLEEALKAIGQKEEKIPDTLKDLMKSLLKEDVKPETKSHKDTYLHPPRLPTFSGKDKPGSGEVTYDLWRYELVCIINDKIHSKELITQSVRRSLRGDAGKVVMRLGPHAELSQIIDKMDSVFGIIEEKESVLREFYNASQREDEDVSSWSFRLEDILEKAIQTDKVKRKDVDGMLHNMLWKGLRPTLKAISHYEKEKYTTFDSLRVALRRIEKDNILDVQPKLAKGTSKKAVVKSDDEDTDDQEVKGMLKAISAGLDKLEAGSQQRTPYSSNYQNRGRGFSGRYQGRYSKTTHYRGSSQGQRGGYQVYKPNTQGQHQGYRPNTQGQYAEKQEPRQIFCNRCGQQGHLARGCRNRPGQYKDSNAKQSTPEGRL